MNELNFKTSFDNAMNMQTDILCDIYCWQQIILDRLAHQEAKNNDCQPADVMEVWQIKKDAIRKNLLEQLFAKHGPDISKDAGL